MQNILWIKRICRAILTVALVHGSFPQAMSQNEYDPLYWTVDSTLQTRLDTLPKATVLAEIQTALNRILAQSSGEAAYLPIDTINSWNQVIRQAVILGGPDFGKSLEAIAAAAVHGDRGHWQHYWVYMSLWGAVRLSTAGFTNPEIAAYYLSKLDSVPPDQLIFYEDRLLDMGSAALPAVIAYARTTIVPRMQQSAREILSEEDLIPYNAYYHFLDLVAAIIRTGADRDLFRELLRDPDEGMRRFARDILNIIP